MKLTQCLVFIACILGGVIAALDDDSATKVPWFSEEFDELDLDLWEHELTGGGGGNWEFQYYVNNRSNSFVEDGILHLRPTLAVDKYGPDFPSKGAFDFWGAQPADTCTGNEWYGCERHAQGDNYVNPIQSARLRSVRSFNLLYGSVEIKMKLPKGDWIWPAVWMLPKTQAYGKWPASGEIDLMESRGNDDLLDGEWNDAGRGTAGATLHWGPYWPLNYWHLTHGEYKLPDKDAWVVVSMDWSPNRMSISYDGVEVMSIDKQASDSMWQFGGFDQTHPDIDNPWQSGSKLAPFDKEFYFVLNVAVGGTGGYFPDNLSNGNGAKPWSDSSPIAMKQFWDGRGQWLPTWPEDSARDLQIDYIRVWKNERQMPTKKQPQRYQYHQN